MTDQEANLATAIDDLNLREGGRETLQSINSWDAASKKALWENPELLDVFHTQRMNGVYAKITAEMERLRVLGQLSPHASFLSAYKMVGDELARRGAFQPAGRPTAPAPKPAAGTPVAVRPASTPGAPAKDPRIAAAAPTRVAPRSTGSGVALNYLAMDDNEFLKQKPPPW